MGAGRRARHNLGEITGLTPDTAYHYQVWGSSRWMAAHECGPYLGYLPVTATPERLTGALVAKEAWSPEAGFSVRDRDTLTRTGAPPAARPTGEGPNLESAPKHDAGCKARPAGAC